MRLNSLQTRVLTALVLMSALIVSAVGFQGYHCGRMAIIEMMHRHVSAVAEARATLITAWIRERNTDIRELSVLPALLEGLDDSRLTSLSPDPAVAATLRLWVEDAGHPYEDLTIFDTNWQPVASSGSPGHLHSAIIGPEIRHDLETTGGVQFGMAHLHASNDIGIHVGVPITSKNGERIGYLVANLNMSESLTPLLQNRSGLMTTGKAFVFDNALDLLTEPFVSPTRVAMKERVNPFLQTCVHAETHGVQIYMDYLGHRVVGTARPLRLGDWAVGVEIDADEAMDWINKLLLRALIMGLSVVAGTVLVSIWLSRMLGRPLAQLAATAHSIAAGNTMERLPLMRLPEAEEVRQAFNRMLDELQAKERELVNAATLATVGELTSSVVHEMRNPLSSVKMNVQSLALLAKDSADNEELAQIAMAQVQRLETMLNELLQYGRPVALNLANESLTAVIGEAIELCRDVAERQGVTLAVEGKLEGRQAFIDVDMLSRALANLIRNAVEASPKCGTVRVIACAAPDDDRLIKISVLDDGPGIRSEHLARLFTPFFTTKAQGTGLGLANVKKIVTMHRGEVIVERRDSGGTVFTVRIPAQV